MTLLEAALAYAERGWAVLPVSEQKAPLTPHGVKDASKSLEMIQLWFAARNPWGIAIATGAASGIDVIDVDQKSTQPYPETYTVETPHGYHLYYQRGAAGNRVRVQPNVDIRSTGGYVVAPPSPGYQVITTEATLAPWPKIIIESSGSVPIGPGIAEGSRDDSLFKYACWLRGQGIKDRDLAELVHARNWTYKPPLTEKEVEIKIAQALKHPSGRNIDHSAIRTIALLDVKEEKLKWAIKPWLLADCVISLEGDGGVGKSLLAMHWCSVLSQQGWNCIYASAEEIASTMLRPRALAAGTAPERISFVQKQDVFKLPDALHALEETIVARNAKFVVLDPLTSFFASTHDMNNTQACREIVEGLNNLAERTQSTFLVIRHWNKATDSPLSTRGMGSKDLGNFVRSQLGVIRHPENDHAFLLFGIKCNFADPITVAYDKGPDERGGWRCFDERSEPYWTHEKIEWHVRNPQSKHGHRED